MECLTPFYKKQGNDHLPLPCGKCPPCLARRVSGWSFRLMKEQERSLSSHFITLTYDTKHVPITNRGFMSLEKSDVQKFFKRLRKRHNSSIPLKYYAAGEYGGRTFRPHYHIILFNADIAHISPSWERGSVHYGIVTGASVGYTLKYITKQKKIPLHQNDDRVPEFALMSKRLGDNYLTKAMIKWHHADMENRMYINYDGNKKAGMPRYYKNKIYSDIERKIVGFHARKKMLEQMEERLKLFGDDYFRIKAESDKQQFARMHKRAEEGRNKI